MYIVYLWMSQEPKCSSAWLCLLFRPSGGEDRQLTSHDHGLPCPFTTQLFFTSPFLIEAPEMRGAPSAAAALSPTRFPANLRVENRRNPANTRHG